DQIAAAGHPVSVIYGALPPEVRRREAERFAEGASHILVATDAIGMGLNLPIRRVLFSTLTKFDGIDDRPLGESEVHQIAGRAGRFGIHEEGFVGVLKEAEPGALKLLTDLLPKTPRAPRDFKAPVAPNNWHVTNHLVTPAAHPPARRARRLRRTAEARRRALRRGRARADADAGRPARQQRRAPVAQGALHLRAGAGGHAYRQPIASLPRLGRAACPLRPGRITVVPRPSGRPQPAGSDGAGAARLHAVAVAGLAISWGVWALARSAGAAWAAQRWDRAAVEGEAAIGADEASAAQGWVMGVSERATGAVALCRSLAAA
ncbi:MAG: hypothetical protein HC937_04065, partial [Aquincola sp.]|nr:hypothetical protein [Aquincola sp.]